VQTQKGHFVRLKDSKRKKGGFMRKKLNLAMAIMGIPIFLLLAVGNPWADEGPYFPPLKVGDEAPTFQLPSSQDRLVDYYKDYYGKHHLIITFFPAAFTPV
jgi:hypothetical protein